MLHLMRSLRILLAAAALASTVAILGCAGTSVGVRYRVYDPYRSDYHVWDRDQGFYYNQWTIQTHRGPHRDFRKLKPEERTDYWKWRHDNNHR